MMIKYHSWNRVYS